MSAYVTRFIRIKLIGRRGGPEVKVRIGMISSNKAEAGEDRGIE